MASYYDERYRSSDSRRPRHNDGYRDRRPRDHSPDRPRFAQSPHALAEARSNLTSSSRIRPDQYVPTRYSHPSAPFGNSIRPQTAYTTKPAAKSGYPPSPAVEEEGASLAHELNPPPLSGSDLSEVSCRGSLDQQPIILDASPIEQQQDGSRNAQPAVESRSGKPDGKSASTSSSSTATDSSTVRGRKASQQGGLGVPGLPDLSRRAPSPYHYTPKATGDSGYFSSSDAKQSKPPQTPKAAEVFASEALRGLGKQRNPNLSSSSSEAGDDRSDISSNISGARKPARYSFAKTDLPETDVRTPALESTSRNEASPRVAELKANASGAGLRRSSDSASTSPRPQMDDLMARQFVYRPAQKDEPHRSDGKPNDFHSRNYKTGPSVSQPSSPTPSPPRSPRHSVTPSQEDMPRAGRTSRPNSRPSSRQNSPNRASGNFEQIRRSSTFPIVTDDKSQRTSKLASSTTTSEIRSPVGAPSAASLPYPVDDMNLMPSEEDHRYIPRALDDPYVPHVYSKPSSRKSSVASSRPSSIDMSRMRPKTSSRHTFDGDLPTLATAAGISEARAHPSPTSAVDHNPTEVARTLKPCPRAQSSRDYDDWYTLEGCPSFDICPSCLESNFSNTMFRQYFKRAEPHDASRKPKCNFSSPWMRMAWLLTQEQHRYDLDLMYALAHAEASEHPCPGATSDVRTWHTILDAYSQEVKNFDICPCDVKRIEALFPSIRGFFQRGHSAGRKRKCSMRVESSRFSEYLDLLIDVDKMAQRQRSKHANMRPFAELALNKSQMRECSRDDLVLDQSWHFAPHLPEFTVCEECYSTIIWPFIADGSSVATRFNRTPKLVKEEQPARQESNAPVIVGTSCQLYSPRMRTVFRRAVDGADFNYLVKKARERKQVELELQARLADLQQDATELGRMQTRPGERSSWQHQQRMSGLQAEFDKMITEWRRWE